MLQFSKISYVLIGIVFLPLLVDCSDSNLQVKDELEHKSPFVANDNGTTSVNQQNLEANSGSDSAIVAPLKKEEQIEHPKEVVQNDLLKTNVNNTLESKDATGKVSADSSNVGFKNRDKESDNTGSSKGSVDPKQVANKDKESRDTGGSEQGDNSKQVVNKDKKSGNTVRSKGENSKQVTIEDKESGNTGASQEGLDSNQVQAKNGNKESSASSTGVKESLRDTECDPSGMCVDEKKNLTACLRVPGNDSPDLSLQIWNKGARPVNISITAPAFVQLEESKVQLQPKEDKKVKVSIAYDGMDSLIFLTTEDSHCTLDFRELVPHDARVETRYAFKLRYLNNWTKTHFVIFLTLSSFLVFGCAWMYFGLHKKLVHKNGYQAVEMELPVSDIAKTVPEPNGGWDNSWDDSWGDEEAPMTPTLPATPNLSSRGLASRRLSKEGWKD